MQGSVAAPTTHRWLRPVYLAAGVLMVAVGAVGLFLPLVPTTGPLLLAAFFFTRSSERLHTWLITHRRFGPFVRDFQEHRAIPRRAKVVALVAMAAAFGVSLWMLGHPLARVAVLAVAVWAMGYVARLPLADR